MFMRYRGGGIGHKYMREVEDRFEDMRRDQVDPEEAPQAAQLPQDEDDIIAEPLTGVTEPVDSTGSTSTADGDGNNHLEEETPDDERSETHLIEGEYLSGEDGEEDSDSDGGYYGMAEY